MPAKLAQPDPKRCVSCGACERECPRDAVRVYRGCYALVERARCVGCGLCARVCPADCIRMETKEVPA